MKKKTLLRFSLLSLLPFALAGCQKPETSSLSKESSVTPLPSSPAKPSTSSPKPVSSSSGKGTSSSSSSSSSAPKVTLKQALAKNYDNLTLSYDEKYLDGDQSMETVAIEYCFDGYTAVRNQTVSSMNEKDHWTFYHDYNGKNYQYFEKRSTDEKGKNAWLLNDKDDNSTTYSLGNTDFSLPLFLKNVSASDFTLSDGLYVLGDTSKINTILSKSFSLAYSMDYDNGFTSLGLTLESGYLSKIQFVGTDTSKETLTIRIDPATIGTTNQASTGLSALPPAPNSDNVMPYWEYRGWNGPKGTNYIAAVTLKIPDGSDELTLDIDRTALLEMSYVGSDPDSEVSATNATMTFHSTNPKVATLSYTNEGTDKSKKYLQIHTLGAGTTELYVRAPNAMGDDLGVRSNRIAVTVNPIAALSPADAAVYDVSFTGIDDATSEIATQNAKANGKPITVKAEGGAEIRTNTSDSDAAYGSKPTLVLYTGGMKSSAGVTFDFGKQQVSSLAFYYGLYKSSGVKDGLDNLSGAKIETSADGSTWTEVPGSFLSDLKKNASTITLRTYAASFDPTSHVRITVSSNMLGKPLPLAIPEAAFGASAACHDYVPEEDVKITKLELTASRTSLAVGKTATLNLVRTPSSSLEEVTFHSSDDSVLSVDETGLVTAKAKGTATVTAKSASGVESQPLAFSVYELGAIPSKMVGRFDGESDSNKNTQVTFSVEDGVSKALVKIDSKEYPLTLDDRDGNFYVFADGQGNTISAKLDTSDENSLDMKGSVGGETFGEKPVSQSLTRYIAVTGFGHISDFSLTPGQSVTLDAYIRPSNATDQFITYSLPEGQTVATLSSEDAGEDVTEAYGEAVTLNAKVVGKTTLTVSAGEFTKTYEVEVHDPVLVTKITIKSEKGKKTLKAGEKLQLLENVEPDNADNVDVTWSSSDNKVATVDSQGEVTGIANGNVTITATAQDGSGVKGTIDLTVTGGSDPSETKVEFPAKYVGAHDIDDKISGTYQFVFTSTTLKLKDEEGTEIASFTLKTVTANGSKTEYLFQNDVSDGPAMKVVDDGTGLNVTLGDGEPQEIGDYYIQYNETRML